MDLRIVGQKNTSSKPFHCRPQGFIEDPLGGLTPGLRQRIDYPKRRAWKNTAAILIYLFNSNAPFKENYKLISFLSWVFEVPSFHLSYRASEANTLRLVTSKQDRFKESNLSRDRTSHLSHCAQFVSITAVAPSCGSTATDFLSRRSERLPDSLNIARSWIVQAIENTSFT